jgi:hypothetical protein
LSPWVIRINLKNTPLSIRLKLEDHITA